MFFRRQNLLLIILGAVIFLIVILTISLNITSPANKQLQPIPTKAPIPTTYPIEQSKLTPTKTPIATTNPTQQSNPPVQYNDTSQQKLLNKFEQRQPLSDNDALAKAKILSVLPSGQKSGSVYRTTDFNIDYLSGPNIFQVEILTTNIETAKSAAVVWFLSQGLSQNAICNYPVQFYLNFSIANQLRNKNIIFNPLADGC